MNEEQRKALSPMELANFYGTENYYIHPLARKLRMTDGVKHVSDNGLAWFVDIIATEYHLNSREEPFQVWVLTVKDSKATIRCEDGNHNVLRARAVHFTDFPYPEFNIWVQDGVLMLPSEY